jgi:glycosyltransferase involved in cell wall biosynthesis
MNGGTVHVMHVLEALEGGTARHLVALVRHVHGVHHEVVIPPKRVGGMTDLEAAGELRAAGATVHLLGMRRTPWEPANARALVALRRLLTQRRPDVAHAHSSIAGLLTRVAATGTGIPTVYTPHGITSVRAGRLVERALRARTARFVAVSGTEAELAASLGLARPEALVVVPNGISLEEPPPIDLRGRLGLTRDTPLVGTIARLVPQKAPEHFVAACAQIAAAVPDARFVLIGGGEQEGEVEAAIDAHGLRERLTRLDQLPGAAGALGQLDVFVLASRFEGGPYAPLEAMRAGVATVLTDVVGNRDVIEHGRSGLLVPPEDPAALAQAVIGLLEDPRRRAELAAAGRERVERRFDIVTMGATMEALYTELAGAPRRRR